MAGPGVELHTYVTNRLAKWAIWCIWRENLLSRDPRPRHMQSWWGPMWLSRMKDRDQSAQRGIRPCPVDIIEAQETDLAVQALAELDKKRPIKNARIIVLTYLMRLSKVERAAAMEPSGCVRTYYYRLSHAHDELLGLMNDVAAGVITAAQEDGSKVDRLTALHR